MELSRNSFFLANAYLDKFIDQQLELKSIKAASIACLLVALKVEHAEIFGVLEHQFNDSAQIEGTSRTNFSSPKEPLQVSMPTTRPQLTSQKTKLPNILTVVLSHE